MAIYNSEEYIQYLQQSGQQQSASVANNYAQALQQTAAQKSDIYSFYDKARSGVYTGSRVSSLGNNERLAASGLAGSAYASPQSGYSESSRIRSDVNMQNTLASLGTEKRGAIQSLQNAMRQMQQNKVNAIGQIETATADRIAGVRQADAQSNVNAERGLADYYKSVAASGGTLTDEQIALMSRYGIDGNQISNMYQQNKQQAEQKQLADYYAKLTQSGATLSDEQKAIMSNYGYDYQQLYDIYEKEQTSGKQKQFAQTYLSLLEGGASLTPEQSSVFESVYGVPADQYKSFLTQQTQKQTSDQLKAAISMGDLYYNGAEINPTSLNSLKSENKISEAQYNELLSGYQKVKVGEYAQKIDDATSKIAEAINSGNKTGLKDLVTKLNSEMETVTTAYNNNEISKTDYDEIKADYDAFVKEANIPSADTKMYEFTWRNGEEATITTAKSRKNIIVGDGTAKYEVEISKFITIEDERQKIIKAGLKQGGMVVYNGEVYVMLSSNDIMKLEKAERAGIKDDYNKLLTALSESNNKTGGTGDSDFGGGGVGGGGGGARR